MGVAEDLLGASEVQVAEMLLLPGKGRDPLAGASYAGWEGITCSLLCSSWCQRLAQGPVALGRGGVIAEEGSGTPVRGTRPVSVPAEARQGEVPWWTSKP